jgi:branched-chain amino acid transport system substrate-binding protein
VESVKTALYQFKGETLGGMVAPLTFTPGQPTLINCYFVLGIEDRKFTLPQGLEPTCAPDDVIAPVVAAAVNQES